MHRTLGTSTWPRKQKHRSKPVTCIAGRILGSSVVCNMAGTLRTNRVWGSVPPCLLQTLKRLSQVLWVNLLSSVKSTGCQWQTYPFWCSRAQSSLQNGEPSGHLLKSVSDRLGRDIHLSGLLEVILQGTGRAVRLGWGPPTALSCSRWITAILLKSPRPGDCARRHSKSFSNNTWGGAILELDNLRNFSGVRNHLILPVLLYYDSS